jgi:hypothetical protein
MMMIPWLAPYPTNGQAPPAIRIRDVTDGTTNTLLVGERSSPRGQWAAFWAGYEFGCGGDTQNWAVVGRTRSRMKTGKFGGTVADEPTGAFGSIHEGGAQFLLTDGSCRFISENIQWNPDRTDYANDGIYQLLGTRNDGQVVGEF